jgi:four helix bundle protein
VQEFRLFINIARRSLFEGASMLFAFERLGVVTAEGTSGLLEACDKLSRKVKQFSRSLH